MIIAASGYNQDEDRVRTKSAGFDHHLVKPINFETLISLLPGTEGRRDVESVVDCQKGT